MSKQTAESVIRELQQEHGVTDAEVREMLAPENDPPCELSDAE